MGSQRKALEAAVLSAAEHAWLSWDGVGNGTENSDYDLISDMEELGGWLEKLRAEGLRNPSKMRRRGAIRSDAMDTSVEAGLTVHDRGSVRWAILEQLALVRLFEPQAVALGAPDYILAKAINRSGDTTRSARNELMNEGWIADTGRRVPTPSKRKAAVWDFTPLGWETYREVKLKEA
jgi:hypothetical protein